MSWLSKVFQTITGSGGNDAANAAYAAKIQADRQAEADAATAQAKAADDERARQAQAVAQMAADQKAAEDKAKQDAAAQAAQATAQQQQDAQDAANALTNENAPITPPVSTPSGGPPPISNTPDVPQGPSPQDQAIQEALAARTGTINTGRTNAQGYFQTHGVDPSSYGGDIDAAINQIVQGLGPNATIAPDALGKVGENVFNAKQDASRASAVGGLNSVFTPDFEFGKIGNTADDPILGDIASGQRGEADKLIQNLLARHVITQGGYDAASRSLDNQGGRVRTQLNDIGNQVLAGGRQGLTDIANRARSTASTLPLGASFDPSAYGHEADQALGEFMGSLKDKIGSQVPTNLYDTSGLAGIAGQSQGAQNLKFDPQALAGIIAPQDNTAGTAPKPARKLSSAVF